MLPDEARRARIDRAPQDNQRAVPEMRRDLVDGLLEDRHRGSQEFVDRRSNDDDQLVGAADHLRVRAELQPACRKELAKQLVGAVLEERHLAREIRSSVAWFVS